MIWRTGTGLSKAGGSLRQSELGAAPGWDRTRIERRHLVRS
ncbi:hypothetical protein [Streptomyces misionensis]